MREVFFDPANRFDEIDRVVTMRFDPGANREYVGVKDDVHGGKANDLCEDPV